MRIAFLCKRRYMGKDVILDRYARLYEIPFQLAQLGHGIRGYCFDYHSTGTAASKGTTSETWTHDARPGSLEWTSAALGSKFAAFPNLLSYPSKLLHQLREFKPDVLIGASDIPHVALSAWLARRLGIPYVVDLYDNFEGFGQASIPGFVSALRRATRHANLVLTTSEPLRQLVLREYLAKGTVLSMPSSVDTKIFCPGDKIAARQRLGLPQDAVLLGTAGGLYRDKGVEPLYEAWSTLSQTFPNLHLVLAGPYQPELPPPQGERIHYLGHLNHTQVADLFRALDVGVISILDTPFGRFCFPQKAYEMLACGLRVAVADIGEMSVLFKDTPQLLFQSGNAQALAQAVQQQIEQPTSSSNIEVRNWQELMATVEPYISRLVVRA